MGPLQEIVSCHMLHLSKIKCQAEMYQIPRSAAYILPTLRKHYISVYLVTLRMPVLCNGAFWSFVY